MKFNFKKKNVESVDVDMAPMIDMIFILLVFFMVTSTFVVQPGFKIDLPQADNSDNNFAEYLTLYVNAEGRMFLNDTEVGMDNFQELVKEKLAMVKTPTLSINADRKFEYGTVINIIDLAKNAGVKDVVLTTEPVSPKNENPD